jgi:hypothetical protein
MTLTIFVQLSLILGFHFMASWFQDMWVWKMMFQTLKITMEEIDELHETYKSIDVKRQTWLKTAIVG